MRGLFRFSQRFFQLPLLAVCGFIVLTPNFQLLPLFPYDEKRLLALGILTLAALLVLTLPRAFSDALAILPRSARLALAFVGLLGLLSAALSASPRHAFLEVGWFVLLFVLALALAESRRRLRGRFDRWVISAIAASAGLYLVAFGAGYFAAAFGSLPLRPRDLFGNFANIRFFGQFLSWTLPLIVLAIVFAPANRRWPLAVLASGWWMLLFVSGTRGTMVGITAAVIAVLLAGGGRSLWMKWQAIAAAGGALLYALLLYLLPPLLAIDASGIGGDLVSRDPFSSSGRAPIFAHAWLLATDNPWLGAGPMHFACNTPLPVAHPHNALLQLASEWGIPATLTMTIIALWGLVYLFEASRRGGAALADASNLHMALLASLVTAAVHALVSGIMVMPLSQIMLALVVGWVIGLTPPPSAEPSGGSLVIRLVAAIALTLVWAGAWRDIPPLFAKREAGVMEAADLKPRFWQRGTICLDIHAAAERAPVLRMESGN